jgi:hypothetical protein
MGDFFQLICSVTSGDSPFTFHWLHQNKSFESSYETRIEETKRSSMLSIESVSAKNAGEYTCKVLNNAGFSSITTALVVKGWSRRILLPPQFFAPILFDPKNSLLCVEIFQYCRNFDHSVLARIPYT